MVAVINLLDSGYEMGVEFAYKIQDQSGGIAQALGLAERFAGHNRCVIILGDNVFEDEIGEYVQHYMMQSSGTGLI